LLRRLGACGAPVPVALRAAHAQREQTGLVKSEWDCGVSVASFRCGDRLLAPKTAFSTVRLNASRTAILRRPSFPWTSAQSRGRMLRPPADALGSMNNPG